MKILLVQVKGFANGAGGTEKVCVSLANSFSRQGHEVIIATNENKEGVSFFTLEENVTFNNIYNPKIKPLQKISVEKYRGKNIFKKLARKLKRFAVLIYNKLHTSFRSPAEIFDYNVEQTAKHWKKFIDGIKPDLIVTMSIGSLVEISYRQTYDMPIIDSVNGRPDYDYTDLLWYRSPEDMNNLQSSYAKLSGIQILFENYKPFLPKTFHGEIRVIPNIVPQVADNEIVKHRDDKDNYLITTISSLNISCKQQDMAIRVFAKLANVYPNWNLEFWGSGGDKDILEEQIKNLGLETRIFLKGRTTEPLEALKQADIFIFPSKYEGFPLALTEAMSVGLPCIGLQSCSGVNELIKDGVNGFLAADEAQMCLRLEELMNSSKLRNKLSFQAHEYVKQYNPEFILESWNDFVMETYNRSKKDVKI